MEVIMDQEISKGTWVGATILAIVAILGLSFAVYGIARTLVNNNSADFVKTVDDASNSSFNDYDGTVVSGLQVRSAIDNYAGDKYSIFVNTAGIRSVFAKSATANQGSFVRKEALAGGYDQLVKFDNRYYMVYNALLDFGGNTVNNNEAGTTGVSYVIRGVNTTETYKLQNTTAGYVQFDGPFATIPGTADVKFNLVKTNYKTTGCSEFISTGSQFNAKLIKDASGTIIGMMFTQVASN